MMKLLDVSLTGIKSNRRPTGYKIRMSNSNDCKDNCDGFGDCPDCGDDCKTDCNCECKTE